MNIVTALPGITPKGRNYTMGQWPQTQRKMRNGRVVRWAASSKPTGDRMDLSWENITYAQAEELCKVWDENYGTYGTLTIPPEILAGTGGGTEYITTLDGKIITTLDGKALVTQSARSDASGALSDLLTHPLPGSVWQFAGPPRTTAVKARRCTVQIPIQTRGYIAYHS